MTCRLIETAEGESFVAQCGCRGEWRDLERVEGAAHGFPSWNFCHGIGGHSLQCTGCHRTYVLGGHIEGHGLPDLIDAEELGQIPRLELTRLQRRALDISLVAEDTLWSKAMDLVRMANATGDSGGASALWTAAQLVRGALHREKTETLRAILLEHGIDGLPASLRIARTSDGAGCIYAVNRGALPVRQKVLTPAGTREVDLEGYVDSVEKVYPQRVVDLD